MGIDVYLPVALLCGTAVYLLRRRGPLGRGLEALADSFMHRIVQDRRLTERAIRDADEERALISQGLEAYSARMDRQDATIRDLRRRVDDVLARLVEADGGPDA